MKNYIQQLNNKYLNRESSLELLRIISIVMIIMHHYALYSGFEFTAALTINKVIIEIVKSFGKLGVAIFIIISGFFYDKTTFNIKKLASLMFKVWIYSIIGLMIGIITTSNNLNITNIIKSIFPTTFGLYWFVSCYILLYLFTPVIKKIIDRFEKNEIKNLILLMILVWSILAIIPKTKTYFSDFTSFIMIYMVGAYIKKYNINIIKNNNKRKIILLITIALLIAITIGLMFLSAKVPLLQNYIQHFNKLYSPLILIISILLLNIFKELKINKNSVINLTATTVFGVYLIHENIFFRDIIWSNIIKGNEYIQSNFLIFNIFIGIAIVFIGCVVIDLIVNNLIIVRLFKRLENFLNKVNNSKALKNTQLKLIQIYNKI